MKKLYVLIIFVFCLFQIANSQVFGDDLRESLQSVLDNHVQTYGIKGVSATVIRLNETIWTGVSGTADGVNPVDTTKLWHFTSQSKGLISVVILQLHEEGLLSIDDELSKYLPGLKSANAHFPIKRFLNHTSGTSEIYAQGTPLWNIIWSDRDSVWNYDMFLDYITQSSNDPDPSYDVNNTNTVLLTRLIEKVTGKSVVDEIKSRIFDPLGLQYSIIPTESFDQGQINGIWSFNNGNPDNRSNLPHNSYLTSRVSWIGKIHEAARFERALNSGELLKPETMEMFYQPAQGSTQPFDLPNLPHIETSYGLGISIANWDGMEMYGHGGSGLGYSASYHFPNNGESFTISIANNCFGSEYESMLLFNEIYYALKSWIPTTSNNDFSIEDQMEMTIYPNPVNEILNIRFGVTTVKNFNLDIVDISGRLMFQKTINKSNIPNEVLQLSLPQSMKNGYYFLRVNSEQETITKPFIISR